MREFIENDIDEKSDSRVAIKLFFLRARAIVSALDSSAAYTKLRRKNGA